MSSTVPQSLEGTQAPNTIEVLWEKHRRKINFVVGLLLLALAANYGVRYYNQRQVDREWSKFAANALLVSGYSPDSEPMVAAPLDSSLLEELRKAGMDKLESSLATATPAQRPYFLWLIANKAVLDRDWAKAETTLDLIEKENPNHPLCAESNYPVQVREPEKQPDDKAQDRNKPQEPKLKPEVHGSMVGLLRKEIAAAKSTELPASFKKPEIPADAPRYKISLSGGYGDIVIALLCNKAPEHCKKFQELADAKFWNDIKIDEVDRPVKDMPVWRQSLSQFHFGFESTKTETDRTKWDTSKPSVNVVEEVTGLSHFEGFVAASADSEGKSTVDRIWIGPTDAASQDGFRQVFGYVVEGLDVVKRVCETQLSSSQEEQMGRGKPAENIAIVSVTKL